MSLVILLYEYSTYTFGDTLPHTETILFPLLNICKKINICYQALAIIVLLDILE